MKRTIDLEQDFDNLNPWVQRSINIFNEQSYLDKISDIYNYSADEPERIDEDIRRQIELAHHNKNDQQLINILSQLGKFPYDEPFWYLLKTIDGFIENNPEQVHRIAHTLYNMTGKEVVVRIESQPKLNQQTGPMFNNWIRKNFEIKSLQDFKENDSGIVVLGGSEETGKSYLTEDLNQRLEKRPDLIAKINDKIIIAEAKWIGQSGGNQYKSIAEVLSFCEKQRGSIYRIGIVDGYPWVTNKSGKTTMDRICVEVQESTYNIMSALLLKDYFQEFLN